MGFSAPVIFLLSDLVCRCPAENLQKAVLDLQVLVPKIIRVLYGMSDAWSDRLFNLQ